MKRQSFCGEPIIGSETNGRGYPPHLTPGNLLCHVWKGTQQIGRSTTCLICGVQSNTRNRNGDARFIRAHRRCGLFLKGDLV
jgi:hypothetical protein